MSVQSCIISSSSPKLILSYVVIYSLFKNQTLSLLQFMLKLSNSIIHDLVFPHHQDLSSFLSSINLNINNPRLQQLAKGYMHR